MKQIQLIIFLLGFNNFFGQEKPILIVDNDEVFKSEFEQIYWKNKKEKIATKEDLNDYIKLFVNFKLKFSQNCNTVLVEVCCLEGVVQLK